MTSKDERRLLMALFDVMGQLNEQADTLHEAQHAARTGDLEELARLLDQFEHGSELFLNARSVIAEILG